MKTFSKILCVTAMASGALMAGDSFFPASNISPISVEIPRTIIPYIGGTIGTATANVDSTATVCGDCEYDKKSQVSRKGADKTINWGGEDDTMTASVIAGVQIYNYLAIEGRFGRTLSDYEIEDHEPISFTNTALYLKPRYQFGGATAYGLLGYGMSKIDFMDDTTTANGFQYGAGASYDIGEQMSFFADYTTLIQDSQEISDATEMDPIGSFNFGIIYKM